MDATLRTASEALMFIFLWIGVPCLLLAVFLSLGLRRRGRATTVLMFFGMVGIASCVAALSLEGLITGEAMTISRHWGVVIRTEEPIYFWVATFFWLGISVALIAGGARLLVRKLKTANLPLNTDAQQAGSARPPRAG